MPSRAQQKGYRSNAKAKEWLTLMGCRDIYLKPHGRFDKDIYGLFDGIGFAPDGTMIFLQIKTNSWNGSKEIAQWVKGRKVRAMLLNVVDKKGVQVRNFYG